MFSNLNMYQNHLQDSLKQTAWDPPQELLIQQVRSGAWEFAFLKSPRWCRCCWSGDNTLRSTALDSISFFLGSIIQLSPKLNSVRIIISKMLRRECYVKHLNQSIREKNANVTNLVNIKTCLFIFPKVSTCRMYYYKSKIKV